MVINLGPAVDVSVYPKNDTRSKSQRKTEGLDVAGMLEVAG